MHATEIKIRFYELDPYNHLNHAGYVQFFEVARIELLEAIGHGMAQLADSGYRLVVHDLSINFLRSAGPGDTVRIETEVLEIGRASARWGQRMFCKSELLATQEITAAVLGANGRPTRFPPELSEAMRPHLRI